MASSTPAAEAAKGQAADPENRLLWRMNRRRLEAESLRDAMLVVSGQLDRAVGGTTLKSTTSIERDHKFEDVRRSVYTAVLRNKVLELFEAFDFADPNVVVGRRNVSTVATQALFLLNSPFVMAQARAAAKSALATPGDDKNRVDRAYRVTLGRLPAASERQLALRFVEEAGTQPSAREAVWERVYQALFACLDFRYVE
jgi:hypothetical protein